MKPHVTYTRIFYFEILDPLVTLSECSNDFLECVDIVLKEMNLSFLVSTDKRFIPEINNQFKIEIDFTFFKDDGYMAPNLARALATFYYNYNSILGKRGYKHYVRSLGSSLSVKKN